jgi:hypothetical protein
MKRRLINMRLHGQHPRRQPSSFVTMVESSQEQLLRCILPISWVTSQDLHDILCELALLLSAGDRLIWKRHTRLYFVLRLVTIVGIEHGTFQIWWQYRTLNTGSNPTVATDHKTICQYDNHRLKMGAEPAPETSRILYITRTTYMPNITLHLYPTARCWLRIKLADRMTDQASGIYPNPVVLHRH